MPDTDFGKAGGPARIGVSSCLLGHNTRHDGGNRLDPIVVELIESIAEPAPVCPEMEIGLGSPRPPIQLVKLADGIKARGVDDTSLDVTSGLEVAGNLQTGLSGFIFKSRSPSCGAGSSSVFSPDGTLLSSSGFGVFARAVTLRFPLMPIVEETALHDQSRRNRFILRVFVYHLAIRSVRRGAGGFRRFLEKTAFIAEELDAPSKTSANAMVNQRGNDDDPAAIMNYAELLMKGMVESFPDRDLAAAAEPAVNFLSQLKRGMRTPNH